MKTKVTNSLPYSEEKADQQPVANDISIREKIILEKQINEPRLSSGPTLDLFFHELVNLESSMKRILDITLSVAGLVVLSVLTPFIALVIKLSTRGSVLVKEHCIGYRGRGFYRYAFRTHHAGAENRSFLFGRFLAKTGLQQLPSLINILKGDMTFVGPIALNKRECSVLNAQLTDFYKRFAIRPGLIDVNGYSRNIIKADGNFFSHILKEELNYVARPSVKKDLKTLVKSFID